MVGAIMRRLTPQVLGVDDVWGLLLDKRYKQLVSKDSNEEIRWKASTPNKSSREKDS